MLSRVCSDFNRVVVFGTRNLIGSIVTAVRRLRVACGAREGDG